LKVVDVSTNPSPDFVAMVRAGLDGAPAVGRLAIMVTGIDVLIYQSASEENLRGEGRTPFVARLNFDRERIARDLPYPLILWLESESLNVLVKHAPDLNQWISAHFQFGGTAEDTALARLPENDRRLETREQVAEFKGLLQELNETQGRQDRVTLRKRLAILNALAERYYRIADYLLARKYWTEVLEIAKRLGDRRGESQALGNVGLTYEGLGKHRHAIKYYEQALAIDCQMGDRRGESQDLTNLGNACLHLREYSRAIEYQERQLSITRDLGDLRGTANALAGLGFAHFSLAGYRRAIEYYEQWLAIAREIGDRQGEGNALGSLGLAHFSLAEYNRALGCYNQWLAVAREIGDRHGEGNALANLGVAYARLGETHRAVEYYGQHLAIAREIGDRRGEGNALWNMSLALHQLGQRAEAMARAQEALVIYAKMEPPFAIRVRKQLEQWRQRQ